ncbi:MAG: DUF2202 domain-containing protein [Maribacter sp.]|uniref:DUF2202 domain-containing protein n=1 Tax=Maribacter sp. TaxID=1897614 RepID=UPI003C77DD94
MKFNRIIEMPLIVLGFLTFSLLMACTDNGENLLEEEALENSVGFQEDLNVSENPVDSQEDTDVTENPIDSQEELLVLENSGDSEEDINALLFMLEEEKLARDTYMYLDELWGINQFANIKLSEQTHMNAVANLLDQYNIDYTLLPDGAFENQELQDYYNQFVEKGQIDRVNALEVGATIEDLDIVDLENYINASSNADIILVFESLQCGSRNHLRSFVRGLENLGETYAPQFLTIEEYNAIMDSTNESCGP